MLWFILKKWINSCKYMSGAIALLNDYFQYFESFHRMGNKGDHCSHLFRKLLSFCRYIEWILQAVFFGVYIWLCFNFSVPSVLLLTAWTDVYPTEKVEFKCNIDTDSSDYTFTWSRDGQEIGGSDPNVLLSEDGSLLTITVAAESSSGGYTCKAHDKTTGRNTSATNSRKLKVLRKFYHDDLFFLMSA